MKLLSVAVPCYNSEKYMEKCIHSLLKGGEDMEILIINDGSKDGTARIADEYAEKYPEIVRAIHQENKGHGGAVNTGLEYATGLYFKVVDSDDWLNEEALKKVMQVLEKVTRGPETLDALICNYVYEKEGAKRKRVMHYHSVFPEDRIFTWSEAGSLALGQYILMHSLIYRTELLRQNGINLPEHTFYVDNIFAFHPMLFVKKLYYLDVNLYRYFIGRNDQSVNEKVMLTRMDQQLKVNKLMIDYYDSSKILHKKQRAYMIHNLSIIMAVSSILLIRRGDKEALEERDQLWKYLKEKDAAMYRRIRHGVLGKGVNLPGKGGRKASVLCYKIAQRLYGFN